MTQEPKKPTIPFLFPTSVMPEANPGEITWRCDYTACIERGGIMSCYGVTCQSENFRDCSYYPSHQKNKREEANAGVRS